MKPRFVQQQVQQRQQQHSDLPNGRNGRSGVNVQEHVEVAVNLGNFLQFCKKKFKSVIL